MTPLDIDFRPASEIDAHAWDDFVRDHAGNPTQLAAFASLGGRLREGHCLTVRRGNQQLQWMVYLSQLLPGCPRVEIRSEPTTTDADLLTPAMDALVDLIAPVWVNFYDMVFSRFADADWLRAQGFTPVRHFGTIELDLTLGIEALRSGMQKKQRNRVNKGRREGMTLRHVDGPDAADQVYPLVRRTLDRNDADAPSLDYVRRVARSLGGAARLYVVERSGEVIGSSFELVTPARALGWLAGTTDDAPNGTSNFMQWAIIEDLVEHGIARYDLGGVDPDAPPDSKGARLLHSKAKYGGALVHCYGGLRTLRPLAARADRLAEWSLLRGRDAVRRLRG